MRRQQRELVGLAGIRQHYDDVVGRDHAEIAVSGLGRVHEKRRRARRSKRRRELACDVARFTDPGNDDAPAAMQDQLHRVDEWRREPRGERRDCARLGRHHLAGEVQGTRRIDVARGVAGRGLRAHLDGHAKKYTA